MDINQIAARLKAGTPVTDAEKAFLIRNNPYALAAFMIDNNAGAVNYSLKLQGYDHLGFEPNKTALARQLTILLDRGTNEDLSTFNQVVKEFNVMPDNLSEEFIREITAQFNT